MTRSLRIQFPGAIYHVTSRGNRRDDIFWDDTDRGEFWTRLGQIVERFRWEMFAAVLMSNHFHFFLRTLEANLSRGMQNLLGGYAQWFNRRHQRVGHVFQGRFGGHLVENESYFWEVSRYVHLNPVPVLVGRPEDWPWSTYAGYLDAGRRWPWVADETLLSAWQGSFGGATPAQHYRAYVEAGLQHDLASPFSDAIDGWILGSQDFAERIRQQLQPTRRRASGPRRDRLEMGQLLQAVCDYFRISELQLATRGKRHPSRAVMACLARRFTAATLAELAPLVGLARPSSLAYLIQRAEAAASDSEIQTAIAHLEQQLQL